MVLCEHAFCKPEEKYLPRLYCKIGNTSCIYSKKCLKVDRFVPLEGEKWKECYKYIMEKINNIPKDSYLVQTTKPHKSGKLYLYVLTAENKIERILSNFTKLEQEYVYLRKNEKGEYQVSLKPFAVEQPKVEEVVAETVEKKTIDIEETIEKPKKRTYNKKKEPKKEVKHETERD